MHALIIEDEALISMLIEDALEEFGYTSSTIVSTEADAIEAARARCPDLITADDHLSEGSGVEAVRVICADQIIPAVFILGDADAVENVVPHGYVMAKPFVIETLRNAITNAITRAREHGVQRYR